MAKNGQITFVKWEWPAFSDPQRCCEKKYMEDCKTLRYYNRDIYPSRVGAGSVRQCDRTVSLHRCYWHCPQPLLPCSSCAVSQAQPGIAKWWHTGSSFLVFANGRDAWGATAGPPALVCLFSEQLPALPCQPHLDPIGRGVNMPHSL